MLSEDAELVAAYCRQELPLAQAKLSNGYGYVSMPHCVINSVFSIGVRYEGVLNVIRNYDVFLTAQGIDPAQHHIGEMLRLLSPHSAEECADQVFLNRQRTSTKNGILKAEAVLHFARTLEKHGASHREHSANLLAIPEFEENIRLIPGQTSGVSLKYFFMLCGEMDYIKPDRMINRFLKSALGRTLRDDEPLQILREASRLLQNEYPDLRPALLDHEIWKFQRGR